MQYSTSFIRLKDLTVSFLSSLTTYDRQFAMSSNTTSKIVPATQETVTMQQQQEEPSPFLRLPPELRVMIYDFHLSTSEEVDLLQWRKQLPSRTLLQVNRQIYNEIQDQHQAALEQFWKASKFMLDLTRVPEPYCHHQVSCHVAAAATYSLTARNLDDINHLTVRTSTVPESIVDVHLPGAETKDSPALANTSAFESSSDDPGLSLSLALFSKHVGKERLWVQWMRQYVMSRPTPSARQTPTELVRIRGERKRADLVAVIRVCLYERWQEV